jgi:hypothetical protein
MGGLVPADDPTAPSRVQRPPLSRFRLSQPQREPLRPGPDPVFAGSVRDARTARRVYRPRRRGPMPLVSTGALNGIILRGLRHDNPGPTACPVSACSDRSSTRCTDSTCLVICTAGRSPDRVGCPGVFGGRVEVSPHWCLVSPAAAGVSSSVISSQLAPSMAVTRPLGVPDMGNAQRKGRGLGIDRVALPVELGAESRWEPGHHGPDIPTGTEVWTTGHGNSGCSFPG